jgi:hypothetical protein
MRRTCVRLLLLGLLEEFVPMIIARVLLPGLGIVDLVLGGLG